MLKTISIIVVLLLFSIILIGQDTIPSPKLLFGLQGGITVSKLKSDSASNELTNVVLPEIGINFRSYLSKKFSIQFGLQFSQRGANSTSGNYKFRTKYIDIQALGQYDLFNFLVIEGGLQYANLFKQELVSLEGTSKSGFNREPISGYNSQFEIILGTAIKIEKGIELGVKYSIPYATMEYSNFQVTFNFHLNHFKIPQKKVKFKNMHDALKLSEQCKYLVIQRKGLKELSADITKLEHLEELTLDGNELKTLPPEIGELKNLRKLSVQFNQIDSLPKEIGKLENLQELYLHHNNLKYLPKEIFELKNLMYLYIGKNQLEELPENAGSCTSLIELDVARSGVLLALPNSINNLHNLDRLYIDKTTIMPIPFHKPNSRLQIIIKDNPEYR